MFQDIFLNCSWPKSILLDSWWTKLVNLLFRYISYWMNEWSRKALKTSRRKYFVSCQRRRRRRRRRRYKRSQIWDFSWSLQIIFWRHFWTVFDTTFLRTRRSCFYHHLLPCSCFSSPKWHELFIEPLFPLGNIFSCKSYLSWKKSLEMKNEQLTLSLSHYLSPSFKLTHPFSQCDQMTRIVLQYLSTY